MDRALIVWARERYGPGRVAALWSAARAVPRAETFARELSLRWEQAAEAFLEGLRASAGGDGEGDPSREAGGGRPGVERGPYEAPGLRGAWTRREREDRWTAFGRAGQRGEPDVEASQGRGALRAPAPYEPGGPRRGEHELGFPEAAGAPAASARRPALEPGRAAPRGSDRPPASLEPAAGLARAGEDALDLDVEAERPGRLAQLLPPPEAVGAAPSGGPGGESASRAHRAAGPALAAAEALREVGPEPPAQSPGRRGGEVLSLGRRREREGLEEPAAPGPHAERETPRPRRSEEPLSPRALEALLRERERHEAALREWRATEF